MNCQSNRRSMLRLAACMLAASAFALFSSGASAADYPSRPVKSIVPFAAGRCVCAFRRTEADGDAR
jgi:tripartite-type tricarboxylate transporter receptor subunit TctC